MLLRYFNSAYLSRFIFALLIAIVAWVPSFIMPVKPEMPLWYAPLYTLYLAIPVKYLWFHTLIAFLLTVITGLIINSLAVNFGLSEKTSYVSFFLYLLFVSSIHVFTQMLPVVFINFFLALFLFNIFGIAQAENNRIKAYNGGLLVGLMSLFYPPMIVLLLVQILGLISHRINELRPYLSAILGVFTPLVYLLTYAYWTETLSEVFDTFSRFSDIGFSFVFPSDFLPVIILGLIFILFVSALFTEYKNMFRRKILKRRNLSIIIYLSLFLSALYVMLSNDVQFIAMLFVPAAIVVNDYLRFVKRKKLSEITVLVLIILVLLNHYLFLYNAY